MKLKVKIAKIIDGEKLKAYATVSFDGSFLVTGVKLLESKHGLYVAMPNKKKNGEYKDICFPLNKELRAEITEAVISAYENAREEDE